MKIKISPKILLENQEVTMPPSKSIAHRVIICASLANKESRIDNIEYSDDINVTIAAMRKMGAKIQTFDKYLIIKGIDNQINFDSKEVFVNQSASTLRFLIPLFALNNRNTIFIGKKDLFKRPIEVYKKIFNQQGLMFKLEENYLSIHGVLQPDIFHVVGNVSSQFISGLLFALPLLNKDSKIIIDGKVESSPYINMTIAVLKEYNIDIKINENEIYIKGNQKYIAKDYQVEGDYSQFAFFAVLGALNNGIKCLNLKHNSIQGDRVIVDILKKLNVKVTEIENGYLIEKSNIGSGSFDISNAIDLAPILCVLGMYSEGTIYLTNAHRLEYKESNRKENMVLELSKLKADIISTDDSISIQGRQIYDCNEELDPHNDHRIFMALVIAALTLERNVIIKDAQCMNKSFPTFIQKLKSIGANIEYL